MNTTYITNATLVLPQETVTDGAVLLQDGVITSICPENSASVRPATHVDLGGAVLMPGLVDLHSDAIEREMEPRPKANLPMNHAVLQGDRKCALAGITTAYHAIGFHGEQWHRNSERMDALCRAIYARRDQSLVDNRIHCRFELGVPDGVPFIKALMEEGICTFVALNNHIPGQGQYGEGSMRRHLREQTRQTDEEIEQAIAMKREEARRAEENAPMMADFAIQHDVPLASHDDDSPEKIHTRHVQGVTISEFPLTIPTAETAKGYGMHAIVGSPNVMRGGSTGSGMSALELIKLELADCLCSDYAPSTLLPAVFFVAQELGWPLHRAARIGTIGPALAARLSDRGSIAEGLRADLIAVRDYDGVPGVCRVWTMGREVLVCP